jgi:hypothetical protein
VNFSSPKKTCPKYVAWARPEPVQISADPPLDVRWWCWQKLCCLCSEASLLEILPLLYTTAFRKMICNYILLIKYLSRLSPRI